MSLAMHVKIIEAFKLEKDLDCQMGLFLPFGLDLLLENKNERNSIIYLLTWKKNTFKSFAHGYNDACKTDKKI